MDGDVIFKLREPEGYEKDIREKIRKLRRKQSATMETSKSEESISEPESFPWSAEEVEEGQYEDMEPLASEGTVSLRGRSVPSEEVNESREDSVQELGEMQVERDSSLKSSPNQESVMVQEKEREEKKEEEEAEEENGEEEKKEGEEEEEDPESLFMAESEAEGESLRTVSPEDMESFTVSSGNTYFVFIPLEQEEEDIKRTHSNLSDVLTDDTSNAQFLEQVIIPSSLVSEVKKHRAPASPGAFGQPLCRCAGGAEEGEADVLPVPRGANQ